MLSALIATPGHAISPLDGDWPFTAEVGFGKLIDGNPLNDEDLIVGVRGTYRFFSGHVGLSLGYSEASDTDIQMVDFAVVYYANYLLQDDIARSESQVKLEITFFTGPGWARIPTPSGSDEVLIWSAGAGANFYWFEGPHRFTSRVFFRPEVRVRWFDVDAGGTDIIGSLSIGYGFGKRLTRESIRLRAEAACAEAGGPTEVRGESEVEISAIEVLRDLRSQILKCEKKKCAEVRELIEGCLQGQ